MEQIISNLKKQGVRMTRIRLNLLAIFKRHFLPLAESEIRQRLGKLGRPVNKTTVYRELISLGRYGVVTQVDFGDGKIRYEMAGGSHHHHLVCLDCRKVEDINIKHDFTGIEKLVLSKNRFLITRHSLEFFGLCQKCQKIKVPRRKQRGIEPFLAPRLAYPLRAKDRLAYVANN